LRCRPYGPRGPSRASETDIAVARGEVEDYATHHPGPADIALVVEVASTLNNRLRVTNPAVFGGSARQAYGLVGPVRIVPYGQVAL
jgi:hypothetical protein